MCLVDTPGIGSVFTGNTRVTREFVPHVDAALVVLGADPPIAGEELALVEEIARETDQLVFVLNKADRLAEAERDEARRFAEGVLGERLHRPIRLLEVSATERLAGRTSRDWGVLAAELAALAGASARRLVRAAAERGLARLVDRLIEVIDEHRGALVRPLAESERRVAALRHVVVEAERTLKDLGPLFGAEQARLARALDEERRLFLARALPAAARELEHALAACEARASRAVRDCAMEQARGVGRRVIEGWLREVEPRAEELYRQATGRFIELANGFLARLRASGDPALTRLPDGLPAEAHFRAKRRFYFTDLLSVASRGPEAWLLGMVRPRRAALAAAQRDAAEYLERLLDTNSARVSNDLIDRVAESRRSLEGDLSALLREIATSAEHALEQARERHRAGDAAVRAELERLESLQQRVDALRA
jgi:hypothetical protein